MSGELAAWIGVVVAIIGVAATLYAATRSGSKRSQNQSVDAKGLGLQAGRDIRIDSGND